MKDFNFIKNKYIKLRESLIEYLAKFDEKSYFYQPTNKSNSAAWIVPHISAFEKIMVIDKIEEYSFDNFISEENIEKYKPGPDGFSFTKEQMLSKEKAIVLLQKTQKVSVDFFDKIIEKNDEVASVDFDIAFNKFMFNFSHETEHFGQLKYLFGTYKRLNEK